MAQSVQRWATGWTAGVRLLIEARHFSLLHTVQIGSGAHPASYPMGTGSKADGAWNRPLASICCRDEECWSYSYSCTPHMSSWRGVEFIKHKDNFDFYLYLSPPFLPHCFLIHLIFRSYCHSYDPASLLLFSLTQFRYIQRHLPYRSIAATIERYKTVHTSWIEFFPHPSHNTTTEPDKNSPLYTGWKEIRAQALHAVIPC
jgi:hypothetical protein